MSIAGRSGFAWIILHIRIDLNDDTIAVDARRLSHNRLLLLLWLLFMAIVATRSRLVTLLIRLLDDDLAQVTNGPLLLLLWLLGLLLVLSLRADDLAGRRTSLVAASPLPVVLVASGTVFLVPRSSRRAQLRRRWATQLLASAAAVPASLTFVALAIVLRRVSSFALLAPVIATAVSVTRSRLVLVTQLIVGSLALTLLLLAVRIRLTVIIAGILVALLASLEHTLLIFVSAAGLLDVFGAGLLLAFTSSVLVCIGTTSRLVNILPLCFVIAVLIIARAFLLATTLFALLFSLLFGSVGVSLLLLLAVVEVLTDATHLVSLLALFLLLCSLLLIKLLFELSYLLFEGRCYVLFEVSDDIALEEVASEVLLLGLREDGRFALGSLQALTCGWLAGLRTFVVAT